MLKLNQVVAIEKGVKSKCNERLSALYKLVQKPVLFNGLRKKYMPKAEGDESLPDETQLVQHTVPVMLRDVEAAARELFAVTAQRDWTNCVARGQVIIDGVPLLDAPVSYLLFLEKQLTDIRTFVANLPLLDPTEEWSWDEASSSYKSMSSSTIRTKKMQKPIVLYDATANHPAQTQLITEDVSVGTWVQTRFSGAISLTDREAMLARVETLLNAVKMAREEANMQSVTEDASAIASTLFGYMFRGTFRSTIAAP